MKTNRPSSERAPHRPWVGGGTNGELLGKGNSELFSCQCLLLSVSLSEIFRSHTRFEMFDDVSVCDHMTQLLTASNFWIIALIAAISFHMSVYIHISLFPSRHFKNRTIGSIHWSISQYIWSIRCRPDWFIHSVLSLRFGENGSLWNPLSPLHQKKKITAQSKTWHKTFSSYLKKTWHNGNSRVKK